MQPTLHEGDRFFVNKGAYTKNLPQRWDVILFAEIHSKSQNKLRISRVVGLPGETLEIKDGKLIINGKIIQNRFYYQNIGEFGKSGQSVKIPDDNYYILSDSPYGKDSRFIGFVKKEEILGKATKTFWPPGRIGKIK